MAIARVQVKVGGAGKAADHDSYISREEKYRNRLARGEALEAVESGNMPAWAEADPRQFWRAADLNERANGTTYREHELALPRELDRDQRAALVREWVAQELGDRHAYRWAIHRPKAADGQDQPHAHLMFSERQRDGIERGPAAYFKRYNAKSPEKGGARKGHGPNAGKTLSAAERKAELKDLRGRWESLVNDHLQRAGRSERIDMRSYAERGIDRAPEPKQLPSAWADPAQRATILEFRQATRERDQVRAALRAEIPDPAAVVADYLATAERLAPLRAARMAAYDRPAAEQPAPAELAQIPGRGRRQDFGRPAPEPAAPPTPKAPPESLRGELIAHSRAPYLRKPENATSYFVSVRAADNRIHTHWGVGLESAMERAGAGVGDTVELAQTGRVPAVVRGKDGTEQTVQRIVWDVEIHERAKAPEAVYADRLKPLQEAQEKAAAASIEALRQERQQWTQAHGDHLEKAPRFFGRDKWEATGRALDEAGRDLGRREGAAVKAADPKAIERAAVAELRRQAPAVVEAADRARRQREALEAEQERKKNEALAAAKEKDAAGREFKVMAFSREKGAYGYSDKGEKWKAVPAELKKQIEDYNRLPPEKRELELARIGRNPETPKLLAKYREQSKSQGMER